MLFQTVAMYLSYFKVFQILVIQKITQHLTRARFHVARSAISGFAMLGAVATIFGKWIVTFSVPQLVPNTTRRTAC
jgi:hypothetical protein